MHNASDEQFSLALQYVPSPAPSAHPDKETREGAFVPPSRVLDALKSPVKVGLSTRGLVQENLRGHFGSGKNDADELFSCETLQFNPISTGGGRGVFFHPQFVFCL